MISAFYAAILALMQVFLTVNVARLRWHYKVSLSHESEDGELLRAARAHGNFVEIVPMALILLLLADFQSAPGWFLNALGLMLLIGRGLHAYAILRCPHSAGRPRIIGMILSLLVLIFGAALNLYLALPLL
ncbi:MAG: MAPEG family protein [Alphaproteobacteria bacterium]|nr:MAPEG family protein [Alphaproteobacteria bacterium]